MILSATWGESFYVCLTEPPGFSHGEHQIEKLNAVTITVNSSMPYELSASLPVGIYNSNKDTSIPVGALNIKESSDLDYKVFTNVDEKLIIKEDNLAGINTNRIDLKLRAGSITKADVYKTTLKFEVQQK